MIYIRLGNKSYPLMHIQLAPRPVAIVAKQGRLVAAELERGRELPVYRSAIQRFL